MNMKSSSTTAPVLSAFLAGPSPPSGSVPGVMPTTGGSRPHPTAAGRAGRRGWPRPRAPSAGVSPRPLPLPGQEPQGQHGQRRVVVPAHPPPGLVLVQPALAARGPSRPAQQHHALICRTKEGSPSRGLSPRPGQCHGSNPSIRLRANEGGRGVRGGLPWPGGGPPVPGILPSFLWPGARRVRAKEVGNRHDGGQQDRHQRGKHRRVTGRATSPSSLRGPCSPSSTRGTGNFRRSCR